MTPSSNAATRTTRYTNSLPERRRNLLSIPLLGFQSLVYGTREKADLFVDTLEDSFQENITPYDDDHIDKKWTEQSEDSFEITSRSIRLSHPPRNM
ncbi:hypothetical protein TNCV_3143541 [Trichonephila clavipes]|nr:hypothetical protein TNCV_3143471 [Trichonephila clavipes]GFV06064.1 hypothetical protein TNCV_3143541 [Trichonephila clavipes]